MEKKAFYRLYTKNLDTCPEIRKYTSKEEESADSKYFVTKYRYATIDQAERALLLYISRYFRKAERYYGK